MKREPEDVLRLSVMAATAALHIKTIVSVDTPKQDFEARAAPIVTRDLDVERLPEFFTRFMSLCDEFAEKVSS